MPINVPPSTPSKILYAYCGNSVLKAPPKTPIAAPIRPAPKIIFAN